MTLGTAVSIMFVLAVCGGVVYVMNGLDMPPFWKRAINVVAALFFLGYLLFALGLLPGVARIR